MGATIFRNGRLFDGHRHRGAVDAVVVRDGRVVALGDARDTDAAGTGARTVDLDGALLAPGFVDAHVHAVQGGLERLRCDLSGLSTAREYVDEVARWARAHPDAPWVVGGGWAMPAFPGGTPTASALDDVVGDRPVFLPNRDHHGAWVSSAALALAGVHAGTPDPPDGRIERDHDGHPTGTLHEGAMALVARHLPAVSDAEYDDALLAGQSYLHSLGVTGWQDAIVGSYAGMDDVGPAYLRAARAGRLSAHVVGALWWARDRAPEELSAQVAELVARRAELTHGRFRATSVKIMQDGVAENATAALGAPYLDRCGHATAHRGHSFVEPGLLRRVVGAVAAEGFQVHVHAIGDRAAREALDAFEAACSGGSGGFPRAERDLRHHIAHLQLVHPDDVPRFAAAGVAANVQALWACLDEQMIELTLPFLGPERSAWQYPFGALHRAGARLVAGSDWPVSTPDPIAAIHVAVNRWAHGEPGRAGSEAFLPEQAVGLETAWAAATSGGAWVNHRDDAGVVRPGARADLVVLDRDPFDADLAEVGAARVVSTWIDGSPVYEA